MDAAGALILSGDLFSLPGSVWLEPIAAMCGVWAGADDSSDHDIVAIGAPAEQHASSLERRHPGRFFVQLGKHVIRQPQPPRLYAAMAS